MTLYDVAQLVIAVAAVAIAGTAFVFTRGESVRAGNRDRLRWMHEALNQLDHLQQEALAPHPQRYIDLQQWLKTCLAVAGIREQMPSTVALTDRPIPDDPNNNDQRTEMVKAVENARVELLAALERDGDLAAAGKRLK